MRPDTGIFRKRCWLAAATSLLLALSSATHAAQILVGKPVDAVAEGDGCSLREALINANTNSKQGSPECTRGSDTEVDVIVLPPDSITVTSVLPVTDDLIILGGSGSWTILDGKHKTRLLDVQPGVSLTVRGVQLLRGYAEDEGANLRLQANARLDAEYLVTTFGRIPSAYVDGRGAGLSIADGAVANLQRSEVSSNETLGVNGTGAGIYCAPGCQLSLSNSTITGNSAGASGAGMRIEGSLQMDFTTIAFNKAPQAAGIALVGDATIFASISADNGSSGIGADFECYGADYSISASKTFIEMPGADCASPAGITSRGDLPANSQAAVLYDIIGSPYEAAPGKTHRIVESFGAYLKLQVPASDSRCANLLDMHGRKRIPGTACDMGSFQTPMVSVWKMGFSIYAHEAGKSIYVHLGDPPTVPTRLRVTPVRGVGENCSGFETFVDFAVGQTLAEIFVDPAQVFALPGLNRTSRVCELAAEIVQGSFVGATGGNVRVKVIGNPVSTARLSTPEPGYYLDFTTVPVGNGGLRSLVMTPDLLITGPMSVSKVIFRGTDASRFALANPDVTETAPGSGEFVFNSPLVLADRSLGGTAIQVRCRPGVLGDFDAEMVVSTTSPVYQDLVYGVRCSEAHYLSFTTVESHVSEKDGPRVRGVVSLDSPCLFDADGYDNDDGDGTCLTIGLEELAGTATSGEDYEAFGGALVFAPGEMQKAFDVKVIDDSDVEGDETVGIQLDVPTNVSNLLLSSGRSTWLEIDEDDQPTREIKAFLLGVPANADPGETIEFSVAVHNRGTSPLQGAKVEVAVGQPMLLRSFAMQGATCTMASTRRRAVCQFPYELAANLKPADQPDYDADEADITRRDDPDWIILYGKLVTADMTKPPTIDIRGTVSVSARAGDPSEEGAAARSLMIDAPPLSTFGGAPGVHWLLLLLLPFRWRRQGAIGRKADGSDCRNGL